MKRPKDPKANDLFFLDSNGKDVFLLYLKKKQKHS
jgi:hypothetical protein